MSRALASATARPRPEYFDCPLDRHLSDPSEFRMANIKRRSEGENVGLTRTENTLVGSAFSPSIIQSKTIVTSFQDPGYNYRDYVSSRQLSSRTIVERTRQLPKEDSFQNLCEKMQDRPAKIHSSEQPSSRVW